MNTMADNTHKYMLCYITLMLQIIIKFLFVCYVKSCKYQTFWLSIERRYDGVLLLSKTTNAPQSFWKITPREDKMKASALKGIFNFSS